MIVGYGIDIMRTARIRKAIERHGEVFLRRIYTDAERGFAEQRQKGAMQIYTAFWAAKEAAMKALGTGNRRGVYFKDIEIGHEWTGKPFIKLHGRSKELAGKLGADNIIISMSHLRDVVVASVIFEKNR